ncbi:MAG TPA: efflux transporter outer membrane subunit [Candidatus Didemnitutus sp.]|nr:efflux transporter outer membrane subunit [Candidatus Didemnitutus sp.]
MNRNLFVSALTGSILLAGCAVGPNYHRPDTNPPAAYRDQTAPADAKSLADVGWWDIYRDPQLKALINAALADGFDARIAAARVEQSRALAAEARGQLFPGVGYQANADRGRNALLGNAYTQGNGSIANGFDGYLGLAWEVDVWGRVRRLNEAARAEYLASEEGRRGVLLGLVSEVATAYFELLELDAQLAITHREADSFGDTLHLFQQRLEGGIASRLETASAEAARASSVARIPEIERQIALKENQISVLIGHNPGSIARATSLEDQLLPPEIPAGIPSQLLERRPDVRAAEDEARAANAGIGATIGSFLPRIGLSALFGAVSSDLNDITSRKAGLWSIGARVDGPLFQGGGLTGQYDAAKARWDEARLRYQQTALNAFAEVAGALLSRQKLAEVRAQQAVAVHAFDEAVKVATQRYAAGSAGYYEVLQAQQQLYPAELSLAQARANELLIVVQLYRALGGGWNLADAAAWSAPR